MRLTLWVCKQLNCKSRTKTRFWKQSPVQLTENYLIPMKTCFFIFYDWITQPYFASARLGDHIWKKPGREWHIEQTLEKEVSFLSFHCPPAAAFLKEGRWDEHIVPSSVRPQAQSTLTLLRWIPQILQCQERASRVGNRRQSCTCSACSPNYIRKWNHRSSTWNNSVALRKEPWLRRFYFIYLLRETCILILPMSVRWQVNICTVAPRGQSCWRCLELALEGVVSCLIRALGKEFRSPARTVRTLDFCKISLVSSFYIFIALIYWCVCVCMYMCVWLCVHAHRHLYGHAACHSTCRGQSTACDSSSCLLYGSLGLNSGPQTWEQVPSLAEPIPWPEKVSF